ncbi:DUF6221 family protein [Streptosporangium canum]|uniref:DUF6221 family protein n=1 Tax=Streptosporangium canum TaxID=324952 RepID=UPI00342132E0
MSDLITFLRARLNEDEQVARAAAEAPWESTVPGMVHVSAAAIAKNPNAWGKLGYVAQADNEAYRDHIARHDPARVLREVEAKRQILDEHAAVADPYSPTGSVCKTCNDGGLPVEPACSPCRTLRLLALPYADHDDYEEDWRP